MAFSGQPVLQTPQPRHKLLLKIIEGLFFAWLLKPLFLTGRDFFNLNA
jgi:hypothetical protein